MRLHRHRSRFTAAAIISSYFNSPCRYFAVFEFPTLAFPYTGASDEKSDGYFAHIVGDKAAGEINNALARIQPKHILLAGVTEIEQTYLRVRLPEERLVVVADISHFLSEFGSMVNESEIVICKPAPIAEGLLVAKFSNRRLHIENNAPDLPQEEREDRAGLIVLEAGRTSTMLPLSTLRRRLAMSSLYRRWRGDHKRIPRCWRDGATAVAAAIQNLRRQLCILFAR